MLSCFRQAGLLCQLFKGAKCLTTRYNVKLPLPSLETAPWNVLRLDLLVAKYVTLRSPVKRPARSLASWPASFTKRVVGKNDWDGKGA
jgi:hypothetical protein